MKKLKALHSCKHIVAIGGGHGLGRVMAALGFLGQRVTGIVATTDDGGSTGRLRKASGCIAWGDLRNCLNQLCSDSPNLARVLFEHRFEDTGDLTGHNLGNLILLAMDQMCVRPLEAINLIRKMLQVEAHLIPMSEQPASLAGMVGSEQIIGETCIDQLPERPDRLMLLPEIQPTLEAIKAIENADLILLGPGSFMTSTLPALLMGELATAINHSAALKVYIGNINKEQSSINQFSIQEKLAWMQDMTGVYPDVLLWPEGREKPGDVACQVICLPLVDQKQPGSHSPDALRVALDNLVEEFVAAKVLGDLL